MGVDMLITRTVATTCSKQRHHMFNFSDSTLSIVSMSLPKRLMMRPKGVVSKKARGRRKMLTSMPQWRCLEARQRPNSISSAAEKEKTPTVQQHSLLSNQIAAQISNLTASTMVTQTVS